MAVVSSPFILMLQQVNLQKTFPSPTVATNKKDPGCCRPQSILFHTLESRSFASTCSFPAALPSA